MGNGDVTAVLDTGPIIHLAEVNSLECLEVLAEIYVPEAVVRELEEGGISDGFRSIDYEVVAPDQPTTYDSLDHGEAAALAVLQNRDGVLLTDDLEARERAKEDGIEVHGTVGLIALAANQGAIDREDAAQKMRRLQSETSLFVTDAVVERGIRLLDR